MGQLRVIEEFFGSGWNHTATRLTKIHDDSPFWLPISYSRESMIPGILWTVFATTTVFALSYFVIAGGISEKGTPTVKKYKASYQITNFFFNVAISGLGLYYEYWVLPTLPAYQSTDNVDRIPHHESLYLVCAMQLGYQAWALPVGFFLVKESTEMIVHHVAVVFSTTLTGFAVCGFRYYTPYFYGLMELSTVPLSIMNMFKDNREWIKKYPLTYLGVRGAFSFSFLYIRIYLWFWRGPIFLRDDFLLFFTRKMGGIKVLLFLQWSMCMFLGCLQFFWAVLVSRGIVTVSIDVAKQVILKQKKLE
jgi:TLC domain